jgi:hypothetical protein
MRPSKSKCGPFAKGLGSWASHLVVGAPCESVVGILGDCLELRWGSHELGAPNYCKINIEGELFIVNVDLGHHLTQAC